MRRVRVQIPNSAFSFLCHPERSEEPVLSPAEGISTDVPTTGVSHVSPTRLQIHLDDRCSRAAVMRLALDVELDVVERSIDRTEVYQADEAFLCGTGVQVAPIVEVDGRAVGTGRPGTITMGLQEAYFRAVRGQDPRYRQWCTPVYGGMPRIT